ncbi:hypothetical protein BANRA_03680 [Escherichia coli]|uniref:Uncharacterized protein n=1 Tax=Escherichia coli TaxID=562 RepID=A0A3P5DVP8_ECOLX|nr:hypothetical protein BANRA_03680 [Escherichia coli]
MRIMLILLCFFSFPCFSGDKIKIVKTCQLKKNESVQLLSLRTIDGDTLYLKFRNVITGAFLDTPTKSYDFWRCGSFSVHKWFSYLCAGIWFSIYKRLSGNWLGKWV